MKFKRLIFIAIVLLFLSSVYGDTVVLKSGREIVGAIVSTEGDTVIIRDVDNIEYRILKSDIERVELGITGTTQQPQDPVGVTDSGKQSQEPGIFFDQEDNNSFAKANYLEIGTGDFLAFDGQVFPKRDRDYYYFHVEKAGRYQIKVTGKDAASRPYIRVMDGNNSTLFRHYADEGENQLEAAFDQGYLNIEDKICFEIYQYGDSNVMDYTVELSVVEVADHYEPNNRFKEAKTIPVGQTTSAYLFPKGDRDYYRIDVDKPGDLDIKVSSKDPLVRPGVRILTAENATFQNWVIADEGSNEVELSREVIAVMYVIEVHHHGDNYASLKDYKLDIKLTPSNDPYEPNDSFANATEIELNRPINATIFRKGDRDYYMFRINNPCDLIVDIKSNIHMRMSARLLTANNSTLLNWQRASDFGKALNFSHSINIPGWYYVEVSNHGDARGSTIPYNLILTTQ